MIALSTIVIFFFVLVLLYSAVAVLLALYARIKKHRAIKHNAGGAMILAQIEDTTDRLKNRWFIIVLVLGFFVIAPFLAFLMIFYAHP